MERLRKRIVEQLTEKYNNDFYIEDAFIYMPIDEELYKYTVHQLNQLTNRLQVELQTRSYTMWFEGEICDEYDIIKTVIYELITIEVTNMDWYDVIIFKFKDIRFKI